MNRNILIVDDDPKIAQLIEIYLTNDGFTVSKASDGLEALAAIERKPFDLVILDVMMPGLDGLNVCLRIRESHTTPILMISAKDGDMDKITGLTTGADDYLVKPFNPLELLARVKSLLRRSSYIALGQAQLYGQGSGHPPEEHLISIQSLVINKMTHSVLFDGRPIKLTPIEFGILHLLASHPGRVFSSEDIFEMIWKEKYYESNNSVTVHMSRLREKLVKEMDGEKLIHTVWGVGYKVEL